MKLHKAVWLFLLCLMAVVLSCNGRRDSKPEEVGSASSRITTLNDLAYPLASMTSWVDANYGACGKSEQVTYYFTNRCHNGADIGSPVGSSVYAIADGVVIRKSGYQNAACTSGWGYDKQHGSDNPSGTDTCNMALLVRHYDASGQPFVAVYGHLRYDPNIVENVTNFTKGQQVGVVGRWFDKQGNYQISGNHLHFGIHPGAGVPVVDPDLGLGFGFSTCDGVLQPASLTFPGSCSPNGFAPPGTFITTHFPSGPPFVSHDPPVACANEPTPDGSWYYSCYKNALFEEGQDVWTLLRLYDVNVNHQFRVKAYKNDTHQWDYTTNMNTVSGTWQYSHFWPSLSDATVGKWRFDLFFVPQGGPEVYVDNVKFWVFSAGSLYSPAGGGQSFEYPGQNYVYNGNGYTCPGPIAGGSETNWVYTCGLSRSTFEAGETVNGLVRLDDVMADYRFSVDTYKNNVYQDNHASGWNDVGQWGWSKTYIPITLQDAQPGNWEFRVSVDEGYGFEQIDTLSFAVNPDPTPFDYAGLVTCSGAITGGQETDWVYTCQNPTDVFTTGQSASALVQIDNVGADFRWNTEVYINGSLQWNWTTGWNDVGEWGWSKAYLPITTSSVWPGNWEYRIYLDTGSGFQYLDSAFFMVN